MPVGVHPGTAHEGTWVSLAHERQYCDVVARGCRGSMKQQEFPIRRNVRRKRITRKTIGGLTRVASGTEQQFVAASARGKMPVDRDRILPVRPEDDIEIVRRPYRRGIDD